MAITIDSAPQLYTTLNLARFKITSDNPAIFYFLVNIIDFESGDLISTQKYATLPMYPRGTSFDVAPVLSSFIDTGILNTGAIVEPTEGIVKKYKLQISEVLQGNIAGATFETGAYYIFNSTLNRLEFADYDFRNYVVGTGLVNVKFLSNRPKISDFYYASKHFLYFLTSVPGKIVIELYRRGTGLVDTRVYMFNGNADSYRVDISPQVLELSGQEFDDQFTIEFGTAPVNFFDYFTVKITGEDNTLLSEVRTYVVKKDKCDPGIDLLFVNNLGGIDTIAFDNVRKTVSSVKNSISVNPFRYLENGDLLDYSSGVFHESTKTIGHDTTTSFSAVTEPMNDAFSQYSASIFESDKVFLKVSGARLFPVVVDQQQYLIGSKRFSTANNRLSISFSIKDVNFNLT